MPGETVYTVVWSKKARDAAKEMASKARETGGTSELARVLRLIDEILRHPPQSIGEIYRKSAAIEEYLAIREFIAFDFAVDTKRKMVLVRDCRPLSGHGL